MTTVRILHAGGVGEYKAGDVVKDAPAGLVAIAEAKVRNAADGELVAEVVEGKAKAKSKDEAVNEDGASSVSA